MGEKLTGAPEGIHVGEGTVTGKYRGTIATCNRTSVHRGTRGLGSTASTSATAAGVIANVFAGITVMLDHGDGDDDDEKKDHKSSDGDGQPKGTAIERNGSGGILRKRGFCAFCVLCRWKEGGGMSRRGTFPLAFWTCPAQGTRIPGRIIANGGTRAEE
jgi:hypothetical protein